MSNINKLEGPLSIGHSFALATDKSDDIARKLLPHLVNGALPETVAKDVKEGITLARCETGPVLHFVVDGHDTYSQIKGDVPKGAKVFDLTIAYADSVKGADLTKMKAEKPNLRRLVAEVKKSTSTYVSNKFGAIMRALKNGADGRGPRGATLAWYDKIEDIFADRVKAAKVARKRGDTTVPDSDAKITAAFNACLKSLS